jgi:solute carrier family 35 protein F1/2
LIYDIAHRKRNPIITVFTIITGQLIALISVGVGQTSTVIQQDLPIPFCLNICYYFLLGIVWMLINPIFGIPPLTKPKFYFFLIIFLDTQANCSKIFAFSNGQLSYPFIINSCTILFSCLFTWFFIGNKYKYKLVHFIGICLTFAGTVLTFYGALKMSQENIWEEINQNTIYFLFAFISSILFSLNTTFMDMFFETGKDIYEFLPWLGIFGAILLFIEGYWLGDVAVFLKTLKAGELVFKLKSFLNFLVFLVLFCVLGTFMPFMIMRTSNFLFNLSFVSQIFWSYIFAIIFQDGDHNNYWYYIGFVIILAGIIVFSLKDIKNHDFKKEKLKRMSSDNNNNRIKRDTLGVTKNVGEEGLIPGEEFTRKKISIYQKRNFVN